MKFKYRCEQKKKRKKKRRANIVKVETLYTPQDT